MLREIFKKNGGSPFEIVGHYGSKLTEDQVINYVNGCFPEESDQSGLGFPNEGAAMSSLICSVHK